MHTQSSQTYRRHMIPEHEQQCYAAMMTMRHLMTRFEGRVVRHRKRLIAALKKMEGLYEN